MKAKLEKIHRNIDKILENIIDEHMKNQMSDQQSRKILLTSF
jgi:hypothetical protein